MITATIMVIQADKEENSGHDMLPNSVYLPEKEEIPASIFVYNC